MKTAHLPLLGLSLALLVASCKKDDFQSTENTPVAEATTAAQADTSNWRSAAQWQTADQQTFSVHYFTIADSSITSEIADKGLVLVFKKNGGAINALPFEETMAGATKASETTDDEPSNANYWYHQVSEGSLLISCDVYKAAATADAANSFKYFVITPEKLQNLEGDGYTTEKLISLNYAEAQTLLQNTK